MPYRRLPNTDQTRLYALQTAVQRASEADFNDQVLSYKTLNDARCFVMQFENIVSQYHSSFESQVSANKQYRHVVQTARMYISHFIQVLNMTVMRGEFKKEVKEYYKLDVDSSFLPDLSSEEDLVVWGRNIIDGEQERTGQGGMPLYNPAITKVKVYYDIFRDQYNNHQLHRKSSGRVYENLEEERKKADALILDIWNQVEAHYKEKCLPYEFLKNCQAYGLIYYYRKGEKHLSAETDREMQRVKDSQPTIQWSESE